MSKMDELQIQDSIKYHTNEIIAVTRDKTENDRILLTTESGQEFSIGLKIAHKRNL